MSFLDFVDLHFARFRRRAAFWWLGADELAVAVLARSRDEPRLELCAACAGLNRRPGALFAPGFLELARSIGAERFVHIAALGAPHIELLALSEPAQPGPARGSAPMTNPQLGADPIRVAVTGAPELRALARREAVVEACALFRAAGLRLVELDAEPCARWAVGAALGNPSVRPGLALDAVALAPELGAEADRLGDLLTVPIGLALARWVDPVLCDVGDGDHAG